MKNKNQVTQYFSKWKKCWVFFFDGFGNKRKPNDQEIKELLKYKYKLK